ncbi:synaptonemal complex central element protein 1-like [Dromiciops gliroides]|uniref:synaptonemal complex central element protein 1-like n=1 Tax=Dromiciops gliroides TaxID=33562 RepID=UPI001CC5CFB2|nr:synaptonemal complex central element protein 1-like [Dromiciops gliroides]
MEKENCNPRIEEMTNIINELQKAHKIANEELRESQAEREVLKKELDELNMEKTHLEEILSMKQETLHILQQHYGEEESRVLRQQAMSQDCICRMTDLNSKIQEEKLRRRKQRVEFEQQLEELMEKHKALWELHTPERLSQEINNMAGSKDQLLEEGRLIQENLDAIEKQLAGLPYAKARAASLTGDDSEIAFLCSEEAAAAMHLFEEENKKATQFLEAASEHYQELQQKYHRLKMELEAGGQGDIRGPKRSIIEAAAEGGSGVVAEGALGELKTPKKPGLGDFSFQAT